MKKKCIFINMFCIIISICILCRVNVEANTKGVQADIKGSLKVISAGQVTKEHIEQFNKIYPDVQVESVYLSDYEKEVMNMIDSGDYGDVLLIPDAITYGQWDKYFEPLGDYDELSQKYLFMENKRIDNKVYGIPIRGNAQGIIYNKKVFDEAGVTRIPTTISEFINSLQLIKDHTDAIPFYTNYNTPWALSVWAGYAFGPMSGDEDYRNNGFVWEKNPFTEGKNNYKVYKLLYDIVNQGLCEEDFSESCWDTALRLINRNQIGAMAVDSWALQYIKAESENPDNIGYMPFPNNIGGKQYMSINADYAIGININSKNKEAARAWIDFMIEDSGYAEESYSVSIVREAPLPKWLNGFDNVEFIVDNPSRDKNGYILSALSESLPLHARERMVRVIEAAKGKSGETFDDIMEDWNQQWEAGRLNLGDDIRKIDILNLDAGLDNSSEIFFSNKEQEYIASTEVVRVGYIDNMSPLQYKENEMFRGISADIFEFIREKTQLNIVYIPFNSYSAIIEALELGEIDVIAGIEEYNEYNELLIYSKDYLEYIDVIVKQKANSTSNPNDIKIGMLKGLITNDIFDLNAATIMYYDTIKECVEAISSNKIDFMFSNYYTVNELLRGKNYKNLVIQPLTKQSKYMAAFRADADPRLIGIINKAIYSMSEEQKQVIVFNNTQGAYKPPTLRDLIEAYPITALFIVIVISCIIILSVYYLMNLQISHNKELAINARRYEQLAEIAGEYIFEYNYEQDKIEFSEKLKQQLNIKDTEESLNLYSEQKEILKVIDAIQSINGNKEEETQIKLTLRNNKPEWYRIIYSIIYDEHDAPLFMIGKLRSIQKEMEEKAFLEQQVERDQFTGVYNKNGFYKMLDKVRKKPLEGISALCMIDMDYFKTVNDTLGHNAGDELILMLTNHLNHIFKEHAIIARFGGDEFMVYIEKVDDMLEIYNKARDLCYNMDTTITCDEKSCKVSISMGVAIDTREISYEELLATADKALYEAKANGRNQYVVYENH